MRSSDFRLGQRVVRRSDETSFVRDRRTTANLIGRRPGIVIGMPETLSPRRTTARIQWEGCTRTEDVPIHRLVALPLEQQPIKLGGQWTPPEGWPMFHSPTGAP